MKRFNYCDREILTLALPSIVQNVTVPLLGLADVTIMGHVGGARHIGAIAVGSMIFNVMYWLCGFLRMGTSGLTAQAFGHGTQQRMDTINTLTLKTLSMSLRLAIGIGLLMVMLQMPLGWTTFWLMQPTADVLTLCQPYYNICIWGAPAVLGLYALTGWFIGMQDTRTPMMVAVAQNVLNIAVSVGLVFCLHMDVEGVAFGTLTAQWAGFLMAVWAVRRKHGVGVVRMLGRKKTIFTGSLDLSWRRFFAVNRDIFLRTLCLVAVNFYFTSAGAAQGAMVLAANTLLMQFFTLFSYFTDGFAYAGEAMAGRYFGAGDRHAMADVTKRLMRWGAMIALLFTLLYWSGGTVFLHLLTTDGAVVTAAKTYLPWAVLIPLSGVVAFVWDGIFIGVTYTKGMLLSCLAATIVFFLTWFLLAPAMGNHALWLALIIYLALRGAVQTGLWMGRR